MGRAYKNFWSLNTDEAVVTGILRDYMTKNIEVFMPINAQMKDVDLILMNIKSKKAVTIQVKGSRAFEPQNSEVSLYKDGSAGWFYFKTDVVLKSTADYFIFLVYVLEENRKAGRRMIKPHTLTIPTKNLKKLCKKYKRSGEKFMYNFFFWINPIKNISFEFRDDKYETTKYLDGRGLDKLNKALQ